MKSRLLLTLAPAAALAAALSLGLGTSAFAQDLTDNATCLECHEGNTWAAPENSDRPRVHTDDGGFNVEDHQMWSCVDCHDYVTVLPHPDDYTGGEVNCLNCHEEVPSVQ
jgi:hypothetical protein